MGPHWNNDVHALTTWVIVISEWVACKKDGITMGKNFCHTGKKHVNEMEVLCVGRKRPASITPEQCDGLDVSVPWDAGHSLSRTTPLLPRRRVRGLERRGGYEA